MSLIFYDIVYLFCFASWSNPTDSGKSQDIFQYQVYLDLRVKMYGRSYLY